MEFISILASVNCSNKSIVLLTVRFLINLINVFTLVAIKLFIFSILIIFLKSIFTLIIPLSSNSIINSFTLLINNSSLELT